MNATYTLRDTTSGWAVERQDGSYAEFLCRANADECLAMLQSGEATDDDYEWQAAD
jgi:hypothetical protein